MGQVHDGLHSNSSPSLSNLRHKHQLTPSPSLSSPIYTHAREDVKTRQKACGAQLRRIYLLGYLERNQRRRTFLKSCSPLTVAVPGVQIHCRSQRRQGELIHFLFFKWLIFQQLFRPSVALPSQYKTTKMKPSHPFVDQGPAQTMSKYEATRIWLRSTLLEKETVASCWLWSRPQASPSHPRSNWSSWKTYHSRDYKQ